ncbi:MAG: hypothetical protein MTP17_02655 [Candidatus Midichloria sp.]|nr:MAG: hypothetical protein MTP17_02655 [Candidatus Midichloria sp.]
MTTADFWIVISFITFITLAFTPTKRLFARMIDEKINKIQEDITESLKVREEAENNLSQLLEENKLTDKKCAKILGLTKKRIESLKFATNRKLTELEQKRAEIINQSLSYQNQIETARLRKYILTTAFAEVEKELLKANKPIPIASEKFNFKEILGKLIS